MQGHIKVTGGGPPSPYKKIETENSLPEFWKEKLNKVRAKGKTSKLLEVVLEEKRREIIKEWIDSGRIEDINNKR